MANDKELTLGIELFHKYRPKDIFQEVNKIDIGMTAVLNFVDEHSNVKSKEISDYMNVSSARMTKLLHKLETKDLIEKTTSTLDNRAVSIKLTNNGKEKINKLKLNKRKLIEQIIDDIGLDELEQHLKTMNKINNSIKEIHLDLFKD